MNDHDKLLNNINEALTKSLEEFTEQYVKDAVGNFEKELNRKISDEVFNSTFCISRYFEVKIKQNNVVITVKNQRE